MRDVDSSRGVPVDIVEAARRGSEDAWRELFDACYPRVYRFFLARTGSPQVAEDLGADVFVQAFRCIDRFQWRDRPFEAWLFGIARNGLASHYRAESRRIAPDRERAVVNAYLAVEVSDILDRLRPEHRQALELRYVLGLSGEEAASAMGRSHNAFRQLLHRAVEAFRREDGRGDEALAPGDEQLNRRGRSGTEAAR